MQKSAVVLDIDGCLLSKDGGNDDNYFHSLAWLAKYIRGANVLEHPNICLCSGRNALFVEAVSYFIGWPHFTAILENGAIFFDPLIGKTRINPDISLKTRKILAKVIKRAVPAILKKYPNLFFVLGQQINITLAKENAASILTIKDMRKGARRFVARLIRKRLIKVFAFENSISIIPKGISKGGALELLAKEQGLDLKQCLAIGDSKNDISFLKKTGLVGCPQNADEACKRFVREKKGKISMHCCAEGVVDIIQWFTQKK